MMQESVPIVASTGAASILVNGVTFNSYFGLGLLNGTDESIIQKALENYNLCERIMYTDTIIIDEVSMISGKAITLASRICKEIRQDKSFFGGIRVIFVGDFFQLAPFSDNSNIDWAFLSEEWKNAKIKKIELKEIMRTSDKKMLKVLENVRKGKINKTVENFLNDHLYKKDIKTFDGTIIFSRNYEVDSYNQKKLDEINEQLINIKTIYAGEEKNIAKMKENLIIDNELLLKKGAFVMTRVNNFNEGYVNGTTGYVTQISNDFITIKKMDGNYIKVKKHTFDMLNGNGEIIARAKNFPLTLAWAITIHKSQGASIDKALISLDRLWLHGQAYTALSRLSNAKGLFIYKWNKESFIVDKNVLKYSK